MTATKEENYPSPILEDYFNVDQTNLTIFIKSNENLTIEQVKINFNNDSLDIIKKSNYKSDVKENLLNVEMYYHSKRK